LIEKGKKWRWIKDLEELAKDTGSPSGSQEKEKKSDAQEEQSIAETQAASQAPTPSIETSASNAAESMLAASIKTSQLDR